MSERMELTDSDRRFLENAMVCLKSPPDVDLAKVAARLGIKPKSAANKWAEVKKKISHNAGLGDAGAPPSPAADGGEGDVDELAAGPTSAKKRKRAVSGTAPKTPKKPRTPRKVKQEVKYEEEDEDEDIKSEADQEDDVAGEV